MSLQCRSRQGGFTLIEIIGAVTAFLIAFLAGSAAFTRLLQQQTLNYQRTVAAAAAMLLVDQGPGLLESGVPSGSVRRFSGGDPVDALEESTRRIFKDSHAVGSLAAYKSLMVTFSPTITDTDANVQLRQICLWYGPVRSSAGGPINVEFVGRFLIPDMAPP